MGASHIYKVTGKHKVTGKRVTMRIRANSSDQAKAVALTQLKKGGVVKH